MATITGTLTGMTLIHANGARKTYHVTADFAAYTGSSDDGTLTGVGAFIKGRNRNGKTHTLRGATCIGAGWDTANQAVYTGTCTVSTDALTFNLAVAAGTEITATTGLTRGVEFAVVVDES